MEKTLIFQSVNEIRLKKLLRFIIPTYLTSLFTTVYTIVDGIFVSAYVGTNALAAINVVYPLVNILYGIALAFATGGSALAALHIGGKKNDEASRTFSISMTAAIVIGALVSALILFRLPVILQMLGATSLLMADCKAYIYWWLFGAPIVVGKEMFTYFIRVDGSPTYSFLTALSGGIFNIVFDYIFIGQLHMGITGAALATIIGQIISFCISLRYMFHFKNIKLSKSSFTVSLHHWKNIFILGASACFNQIAMTVVQIVMNNTLAHYGAMSVYGGDIPLACAGIITKVNMIFMSFVIGISQGTQPVIGFNYGAKKYKRVRKTYLLALAAASGLSLIAFVCFQVFPRQIISIFGNGSELYFKFSERYFRIYMFLTIINGIQPVTSNFFNSIGKSRLGVFMSLTRQILFLLPLIIIFPIFMGIDGVMYAGPIADAAAAIVCGYFTIRELKELKNLEKSLEAAVI